MLKTVGFPSTRTGDQTIVDGNLVIATSGKGIDFSATPGTGTSELLSDYEEGTFTPKIRGTTSAGTGTYSSQVGSYTKIGRLVTVQIVVSWSAHTGTGNLQLGGLPFTVGSSALGYGWLNGYTNNLALTLNNYFIGAEIISGNTVATFYQSPIGGGAASGIPIDTVATLELTGSYFV